VRVKTNTRWRHTFGRAAEEHAARFLERQGCEVLERRFGRRGGEIDLVVLDSGVIVFVEVKARRSESHGGAIEAVTWRKRKRIVATARCFLAERQWRGRRCRFDVVGVSVKRGRATVTWVCDAFRP